MDVALALRWIAAVAASVAEHAEELTRLDAAIGDGDHGVNLHRGFTAVLGALDGYEPATVGDVFTRTGTTLVSRVGGASGPLYGTAFRAIGKALPGTVATPAQLGDALRAGLDGLVRLGGAAPGDKTIVDAFGPAVDAFARHATGQQASLTAAAFAAAGAAADGMRATVTMQARKGRASYLGPRSVGHQDPGATSTSLIFAALRDAVCPA